MIAMIIYFMACGFAILGLMAVVSYFVEGKRK